jgi:hypothetical protein
MSAYEPVLCPVSPELVKLLKRPGGCETKVPVRMWLDADNTIVIQELHHARMDLRHHDTWELVAEAIGPHNYQYDLGDTSERLDVVQIILTALARIEEAPHITPPKTGSGVRQYDGQADG